MLDISNVAKVYSGRIGCMCGCKGKYSYNEGVAREDWQGAVSVRSVKVMAKKVLADARVVIEDNFAYVQDSQRGTIKVVYFKEA
jgi:hypothetical protein